MASRKQDRDDDTCSIDSLLTPTSTITVDDLCSELSLDLPIMATVPYEGGAFIIVQKDTKRIVTRYNGRLELHEGGARGRACYWVCGRTKGWFTFCEPSSAVYMGHDGGNNLRASVTHSKDWEHFALMPRPSGGYVMMSRSSDHLWEVKVHEDGKGLIRGPDAGTPWYFVPVDL